MRRVCRNRHRAAAGHPGGLEDRHEPGARLAWGPGNAVSSGDRT